MTRLNILAAMENRISFFVQILTMIIHQFSYLLLWMIFFTKFPSVHGWELHDTALLLALTSINFSLVAIFAGGIFDLARIIEQGDLDYYIAFPAPALWHIMTKKTFVASLGELMFGIVMFIFAGTLTPPKIALFILLGGMTTIITLNFIIIIQSGAFFLSNLQESATQFVDALTDFVFYPQNIFSGALKFITIFIIPAFFIGTIPITLLTHFNGPLLGLMFGFCVVSTLLAHYIFYYGLRRYKMGLTR